MLQPVVLLCVQTGLSWAQHTLRDKPSAQKEVTAFVELWCLPTTCFISQQTDLRQASKQASKPAIANSSCVVCCRKKSLRRCHPHQQQARNQCVGSSSLAERKRNCVSSCSPAAGCLPLTSFPSWRHSRTHTHSLLLTHSLLTHSAHSLTHSHSHSLTHPPTHSLTHSLTHSHTHTLTQ